MVVAGCNNYGTTGPQSNDSALTALALSAGTLTPAFSAAVLTYTVTVPNTTATMTVSATTANIYATLRVNNAIVPSGQPSPAVALVVGSNLLSVSVVAQDGTSRTYGITVTRS